MDILKIKRFKLFLGVVTLVCSALTRAEGFAVAYQINYECVLKESVPDFSRFPRFVDGGVVEDSLFEPSPLFYGVSLDSKYYLGVLSRVDISSWTCPPNGKSREEHANAHYLQLYSLDSSSKNSNWNYRAQDRYFVINLMSGVVDFSKEFTLEQIRYFDLYDSIIGDNIGVSIVPKLAPAEISIYGRTPFGIANKLQSACVNRSTGDRSASRVDFKASSEEASQP
ncbi:MAG: hypothetical protein KA116_00705 [Proteobacteria bacterium]|nr:hypothetical protein [Pseudomonadota bacterium]